MQNTTEFNYRQSIFEILNVSELGLLILDENRQVTWCNGQFAQWLNTEPGSLEGKDWLSLPLEVGDDSENLYHLLSKKRSQTLHLEHWKALLPSDPKLTVHYFRAINLNTPHKKLSSVAAHLPKRPNWIQFLDYEVSRSRRYDNPLALLKAKVVVFDSDAPITVNGEINDIISQTLKDELRWADMIGHTQTGEFLLILPETNSQACRSLKQKLSHSIEQQLKARFATLEFELVFGESHWQRGDSSGMMLDRAREDLVIQLNQLVEQYQ